MQNFVLQGYTTDRRNISQLDLPAYYFTVSGLDGQSTVDSFETCTLQQLHLVINNGFLLTMYKSSGFGLNTFDASPSELLLMSLTLRYIGVDDLLVLFWQKLDLVSQSQRPRRSIQSKC